MDYIPTTEEQVRHMLEEIGVSSIDDLFADVPAGVRFRGRLNLPSGMAEAELLRHLRALSGKNKSADDLVCFAGGGAYDHLIPTALKTIVSRSEFYTAYTPYQAEISQGVLQTIFEFQTLICRLTGMDVANASVYEGASATAEAAIMACAEKSVPRVLIAETVHPEYRLVAQTYLRHQQIKVEIIPVKDGVIDLEALNDALAEDASCVIVQHPNFYGHLEPVHKVGEAAKAKAVLFVACVDPISLGILEPPAAYGADIAVGEGQSLGNALSFGGPYLGFLAARESLVRRIPGRIVGETVDRHGRRGFVLTLQAREQHIRRQRAQSNICTNQALNALAATAYLTLVGKEGLREAAYLSYQKAHYLARCLEEKGRARRLANQPFFKEFAVLLDEPPAEVEARLLQSGFFAGPRFDRVGLEPSRAWIVCATEARTKEEIERFAEVL